MNDREHDSKGISTRAVHSGEPRGRPYDAVATPVVNSATFAFRDTAELAAHVEGRVVRDEYGRYGNPTVRALEQKLAALEGCADAAAFASGMAAITTTLLALLKSGSHMVLAGGGYRRTRQFCATVLERFGVNCTIVESTKVDDLSAAMRPGTRLVLVELPTNPFLRVIDLPRLVERARARHVWVLVDATFATPVNFRPAEHGADLVIHSATKYLAGHNDVLSGIVAGPDNLVSLVRELRHVLGGVCDPHAAWLVARGMKTLPLRVRQQNATALALARLLEPQAKVRAVHYPGLASHPDHTVARALLTGAGGVVTYQLDTDAAGAARYLDALRLARIAPSLGGVESLAEPPALMSYGDVPAPERQRLGMHDSLIRHSVGIEDLDDVLLDVEQALAHV